MALALAVCSNAADIACDFETVDWSKRADVRARLRVLVRVLLKRYKYPPDRQEEATEAVLKQAESLSEDWATA